jgi:hypothetical protein
LITSLLVVAVVEAKVAGPGAVLGDLEQGLFLSPQELQ